MKIKNLALRAFICSTIVSLSVAYTASAQVAVTLTEAEKAEYYEIVTTRNDSTASGTLGDKPGRYFASILWTVGNDGKVIMNMVDGGSTNDEYLPSTSAVNVAEIYVESWYINNGSRTNSNTFNSAITGAGDIYFDSWDTDSIPAHNTYTFTGDMSNYGGDILTSEMGGLSLIFSGSTRGSLITGDQMTGTGGGVSGRGEINTYANGIDATASAITFNISAGGTSYVTNTSISGHNINFNTSDYIVTSNLHARNALSVGAGASVTMYTGSTVSIAAGGSLTVADTGSLTLQDGVALTVGLGATVSGGLTFEGNHSLNLVAQEGSTSLTLADYSWKDGVVGHFTLNVTPAISFVADKSYNLLNMDMTGMTVDNFTLNLDGLSSSEYTWAINENILSVNITGGAADLTWNDASGETWSTADTSQSWVLTNDNTTANDFENNDVVRFLTSTGAKTVNIEGDVTPSSITVNSDTDYSFTGTGSITGTTSLTKEGDGTLSISTTNSYTGGTTLAAGTLSINSMDALGSGGLTINGGVLAVHGGAEVAVDANDLTLGPDAGFRVELNETNATFTNVSSLGNHALYVTSTNENTTLSPTMKHDAWNNVTGLYVGEGATVDFGTSRKTTQWARTSISGAGTIVTSHGAGLGYITTTTGTDAAAFTGTIQLKNGADLALYITHDNAANRMSLDTGTSGSNIIVMNSTLDLDTLYLKEISGDGVIQYNATIDGVEARRTIDLQMSEDQTFGGRFDNDDARMGNLVVSSSGSTAHNLTLSGAGYTTNSSNETWHQLQVTGASVTLAGSNATWDGIIALNDADATLKFDHSAAYSREAGAGKITGDGSVEIVSTHGVTLNSDNDYTGNTTVASGASLTLNSAGAAGGGVIELNDASTLTIADGLTVDNALSLSGSSTIGGNATLAGDITLVNSATLSATGTVNLSGNIIADPDETLTLQEGDFRLTSTSLDASKLVIGDTATVKLANASTLTNVNITGPADQSFTTTEGGTSNVDVYTLEGMDKLIAGATGELTLDLGTLSGFDANEVTAFKVEGLTEGLGYWYGNLSLIIGGTTYQVQGATNTGLVGDSSLVLYIPEPSTATMSLLALAGLLMRRRRKAA